MINRCVLPFAILSISGMLLGSSVLAAQVEEFSAGAAKVKITPEKPIPMAGYRSRTEPFRGVHDDLFARAIVFSDGRRKAAIVSADVIWFPETAWKRIAEGIFRKTGIPREYVMLCATHTHGGPVTSVGDESPHKKDVDAYGAVLERRVVRVVNEAAADLQPAAIGAGWGDCLMNMNRRAVNAQGKTVLGRNPYGACDHSVGVMRIDREDGSPMAVMLNWSSHATTMGSGNYLITADWPGAAARYVEKHFDDSIISPVTVGSSGNVNPIYGPVRDFSTSYSFGVDATGAILGREAVRVAEGIKTKRGSISAVQRVLSLPGKKNVQQNGSTVFETGPDVEIRLSALKIGDVVFAAVAQEFAEIGLAIKEQSPHENTWILDHCNASFEYIPTDEAYDEGGYEVKTTHLQKGAEKIVIRRVLEMIDEL